MASLQWLNGSYVAPSNLRPYSGFVTNHESDNYGNFIESGKLIDGKREGIWVKIADGDRYSSKITYKGGETDGTYEYFEDAKLSVLRVKGTFSAGERENGPKETYDARRVLTAKEDWTNGRPIGVSEKYYSSGRVFERITRTGDRQNKNVQEERYSEDGRLESRHATVNGLPDYSKDIVPHDSASTHQGEGTDSKEGKGQDTLISNSSDLSTPATYVSGPLPVYPPALRIAGVEGRVTLRFIVDTTGRVEDSTMQVVSSTNKQFEIPAIIAIRASTFKPATIRGTSVRQMVEQVVHFTIG